MQVSQLPDGTSRVVLEGLGRAKIKRLTTTTEALRATIEPLVTREAETEPPSERIGSLARSVVSLYGEYARLHDRIPEELSGILSADGDRVRFAHLVSGHLILPSPEKQEILESGDLAAHLEILREILVRELEILKIERKLDRQIQLQLGGGREQPDFGPGLRAIHREPAREEPDEWTEIRETIDESDLPPHAKNRAEKELGRPAQAESRRAGSGGDPDASRLDRVAAVERTLAGQHRRPPGRERPGGRPLRPSGSEGAHPRPRGRPLARPGDARADPLPGGPTRGRQDLPRSQHRRGPRP